MKNILIIFLAVILSGCNPFVSKELRRKNKCNRKLARVVRKCPELINKTDTFIIKVPEVAIDTFIDLQIDTFKLDSIIYLIKDSVVQKVVRNYIQTEVYPRDTIKQEIEGFKFSFWFNNGKLRYTAIKPEVVYKKPIEVIKTIKLSVWENICNFLGGFFWPLLIILIIIIILYILKKAFIP
jgi:hypothetical protein